jgi:hypothetical protein
VAEEDQRRRKKEFRDTPVYKEDIEPHLINQLANLEARFCSVKDVHQRYALVEAYNEMKQFKLWLSE